MHCPAGDEDLADDEEEEEAFNDEMDLVMVSTLSWITVDLQKEVHLRQSEGERAAGTYG